MLSSKPVRRIVESASPGSMAKVICLLALQSVASGASSKAPPAAPPAAAPAAAAVPSYPFTFEDLLNDAKRRAAQPHAPQRKATPAWLDKLSAEQYRAIRFKTAAEFWRDDALPFRLELLPVGFNFQTMVTVSVIDDNRASDLAATPGMFEMPDNVPSAPARATVPLSGFRILTRINSPRIWDEFLVFQGASYFRAVAKHQVYGLSGRGLALNTAEPSGEEFPAFTHFWIMRPAPKDKEVIIYALLESESTTGAYRFLVKPGIETVISVDVTLFPRVDLRVVGVAPLTSMFLFDETNRGRLDDYRPEVHDSDGLQIETASGDQIWRPLANPQKLQISTFTNDAPQGFGLMQRSRNQSDFQDLEAMYERRPSAWIEPQSEWGKGAVELVEIPSPRETNDNIVAFWRPAHPLPAGHPAHFAYDVTFDASPKLPKIGRALATRVDFVGAGEQVEGLHLDLGASAGKLSNISLLPNAAIHGFRVSFELDTANADLIELRMRVLRDEHPVTETWLYRWTAS
jgi:glucans biosynthesis protein